MMGLRNAVVEGFGVLEQGGFCHVLRENWWRRGQKQWKDA